MGTKRLLTVASAAVLALGLAACGSSGSAGGSGSGPSSASAGSSASSGGSSASSGGSSGSSSSASGSASSGSSSSASGSASSGSSAGSGSASASGSGSGGAVDCGEPDSFTFASDGDVNIQNLWKDTLIPAFNKVCPDIKMTFYFDTNAQNVTQNVAKIAAAQKSGQAPPYDLLEDSIATASAQAGLTEKLTEADIPALSTANQTALAQYKSTAVPWRGSAVLLAYDSSQVKNPPTTLDDLVSWIKANPGKFIYNDPSGGGSGGSFVETVLDSKTPEADLKKMQTDYVPDLEKDWDAGFDILKSLTPFVYQKTYPHGNQDVLNLMASGAVTMAPVWSDQFLTAKNNGQVGDEWKVTQIKNPSFTGGAAFMAIVKGDKHKKAASAFINWVLQPAQQAQVVKTISGFPSISIDSLPKDVQGAFGNIDVQNLRTGLSSKMGSDMKSKWTSLVAGG